MWRPLAVLKFKKIDKKLYLVAPDTQDVCLVMPLVAWPWYRTGVFNLEMVKDIKLSNNNVT